MSSNKNEFVEIKKGVFDNDNSGTSQDVIITKRGVMYLKPIKPRKRRKKKY